MPDPPGYQMLFCFGFLSSHGTRIAVFTVNTAKKREMTASDVKRENLKTYKEKVVGNCIDAESPNGSMSSIGS